MFNNLVNTLDAIQGLPKPSEVETYLSLLGTPRKENAITELYRYFFSPSDSHSFSTYFLETLGKLAGFEPGSAHDWIVKSQVTEGGDYVLDLVGSNGKRAFFIENKIDANLYNDLVAYRKITYRWARKKTHLPKDAPIHGIVLSVRPETDIDGDIVNILHSDFWATLEERISQEPVTDFHTKANFFFQDFKDHMAKINKGEGLLSDEKLAFIVEHRVRIQQIINLKDEFEGSILPYWKQELQGRLPKGWEGLRLRTNSYLSVSYDKFVIYIVEDIVLEGEVRLNLWFRDQGFKFSDTVKDRIISVFSEYHGWEANFRSEGIYKYLGFKRLSVTSKSDILSLPNTIVDQLHEVASLICAMDLFSNQ